MDGDGRKARSVFEEPFPSLQFFDLCAHFSYLSLHFQSVLDLMSLLHDFEKLRLQRLLSLNAGFEIDELFGDVLAGLFCVYDVIADTANLIDRGAKPGRRNADDQRDIKQAL